MKVEYNMMAKIIAEKIAEATELLGRYPNTDELEHLIAGLLKYYEG